VTLKTRLNDDVKTAMRARDKGRLGVLRMALAAIKQREVDERIELGDDDVMGVIEKMIKQRRESVRQYRDGNREDLAAAEEAEIELLSVYLPEQLDEDALASLVEEIIGATGAASMADMGKVMGQLKARAQGRVDMAAASALVRSRLAG